MLIAGRGPLYPALSVAMGERVGMVGALSVEAAAKYLNSRDIDGIVVGDGFSPRMVEAFLTVLAQDTRFRDIPVAVIGRRRRRRFLRQPAQHRSRRRRSGAARCAHGAAGAPARLRGAAQAHAQIARRRRHVRSARPACSRATPSSQDLAKAIAEAGDRSQPLSVARIAFDEPLDERAELRRRPHGGAAHPQHRFCLARGRRRHPHRLHPDRPAQRPCRRPPHRRRAQKRRHGATRRSRSPPMSRWRRSRPATRWIA